MKKFIGVVIGVVAVCAFTLVQCAGAAPVKKAVFIIAAKDFQEQEFSRPFTLLVMNGVDVTVASTAKPLAIGTEGAKVKVDMLLADVKVDDFDAVVFIGGQGAMQFIDNLLAHRIAQDAVRKKKILAAICIAPMILAKAGVLQGRRSTVHPGAAEDMKKVEKVKYTAKPVERDGRIITADGPDSAQAFGQEIARLLQ